MNPWAGAAAAFLMVCTMRVAMADERSMVLEVILNGRSTGRVGEFLNRDGVLYARPSELRELGFVVPANLAGTDQPIPLATLPNMQMQLDETRQTLIVVAGDSALRPTELGGGSRMDLAPLTPSGFGAVLNYDFTSTAVAGQTNAAGLLDARIFSQYGLLDSSGVVTATPHGEEKSFVRLDTTYSYTQAAEMRVWRLGDVVTTPLAWTRSVRLGGVQVTSDFALQPDFVTYPLPVTNSSVAVPSTVNVLVNGVQQYGAPLQPGPFAVHVLPVVTGAGDVTVAVRDALGRQTFVTLPFYASTALLKPGLASYAVEAGAVRENFGLPGDGYDGWAVSASGRYGLYDWLTLESHAETANDLALFGIGGAVQVGTIGVVNAAVAGSNGRAGSTWQHNGGNSGGLISLGVQRISPTLNVSLSGTMATSGYHDLTALDNGVVPSSTVTASVGYNLGRWGSVGVAYVDQRSRSGVYRPGLSILNDAAVDGGRVSLLSASYSVPVAHRYTFFATGFRAMQQTHSYGIGVGVSFLLGNTTSVSAGGSLGNGRPGATLDVEKPALAVGDYGYRVQTARDDTVQGLAGGEYLSRWGRVAAAVTQGANGTGGEVDLDGALTLAGGGLFASGQVDDSFAVVRTGDVAGVPVLYENRPIGTTDSSGELLVPSLRSYENNKISLDVRKLPIDVDVGETSTQVRPSDRSGVVVDFHVRTAHAALLKLVDGRGRPIPLGSVARGPGGDDVPVGYDGEAYVSGLQAHNEIAVVLPDASRCTAHVDYKPVPGDVPVLGPVPCQ